MNILPVRLSFKIYFSEIILSFISEDNVIKSNHVNHSETKLIYCVTSMM